jgi:DNA-binding GntR family transcriptional regulator
MSAVKAGSEAATSSDWLALGTANIRFHQAIAALAGSPRVDELMQGLLAELRLVFHVMSDPRRFHEPYLVRNGEIAERIAAGDGPGTERMLAEYLQDAERQLVGAYGELNPA